MQSTVYQIPEVGLAEYGLAEYGLAEYGLADSCTAEYGLAEYGLARYSPPSLLANYCAPVLQREKIKKVIRSTVAVRTRGLNLNPYHSDD